MSEAPDQRLLEALLDSWDQSNTILLNLLRALRARTHTEKHEHPAQRCAARRARQLRRRGKFSRAGSTDFTIFEVCGS